MGEPFVRQVTKNISEVQLARGIAIDLNTRLNNNDIALLAKANISTSFANVKDFGAKGDGVTDDTLAIQTCINQVGLYSGIYFPPNSYVNGIATFYKVTTLNIPDLKHGLRFLGAGQLHSTIKFSGTVGISVGSEMTSFKSICLIGAGIGTGATYTNTIMFKDTRPNTRADFDIKLSETYIQNVETAISTQGRGVVVDNCDFYAIRSQIMNVDFPLLATFEAGTEDTQTYASGFRGFIFRNNRSHYCTCWIINNVGANSHNLSGVLITDNQLEGSTGYINGYVRHAIIKNNLHIECGNIRDALFVLDGCENVDIDVNISGKSLAVEGGTVPQFCNRLLLCTGAYKNLNVKANIEDVKYEVLDFEAGGKNLVVDINCSNICAQGIGYGMLKLNGNYTYDGLTVRGTISSPNPTFIAVKSSATLVQNYSVNLDITGTFLSYDNLDGTKIGASRKTLTGVYQGNGNATQKILLPYYASTIQVYSTAFNGMVSSSSASLSPALVIGSDGLQVSGEANNSNYVYGYVVN